jgi:microcystin-dependent protein
MKSGDTGMLKKSVQSRSITRLTILAAVLTMAPASAFACGEDAYIGQICVTAAMFCPLNTAEAAGQMLTVSSYQALFSLIGCTYGGDCRNTFALPDLRGRAPVGQGTGPGLTTHPMGQKFGAETVTQTLAQMPVHNHTATFTSSGGSGSTASGTVSLPVTGSAKIATAIVPATRSNTPSDNSVLVPAQLTGANMYGTPGTSADLNIGPAGAVTGTASGAVSLPVTGGSGGTVTVNPTGGSQAMPIVPPEIAMRYCIVTDGIYPTQP